MKIVDAGSGVPIVVIPGIQGRWEWMKPAIDALSARARVITFSLADEPSAEASFDATDGFGSYVEQVQAALETAHLKCAAICGVSYGGLIAAAFAARHPDRVTSLLLVSAIPPSWTPDARVRFYLRWPWLMTPLFCLGSMRLYREIAAANDTRWAGITMAVRHGTNVLRHMFHPGRMARRVHLLSSARIEDELAGVQTPTLVITGEDSLERVVPPRMTRRYLELLPNVRSTVIARTGHLGLITRSAEFASIVSSFVAEQPSQSTEGGRVLDSGSRIPNPESREVTRRRIG